MNQQKGFSLTEVLTSLLLVTTLALSLMQQQWHSKYLLNQLVLRSQNIQLRDQIEETLLISKKKDRQLPTFVPYTRNITN
jgi:prepilin peptidase dependent protein C